MRPLSHFQPILQLDLWQPLTLICDLDLINKWRFPCCIYDPTLVEIHQSIWKVEPNVNLFSQQQTTGDKAIPMCLSCKSRWHKNFDFCSKLRFPLENLEFLTYNLSFSNYLMLCFEKLDFQLINKVFFSNYLMSHIEKLGIINQYKSEIIWHYVLENLKFFFENPIFSSENQKFGFLSKTRWFRNNESRLNIHQSM